MENPSIIMSIDEGPKKGETLDCTHSSIIRIGRVIRGNTLAIKDLGISQKHLTVAFNCTISRWTVTDLGSSNGTAVNGTVISPNVPFPLAEGDIIAIGYKTSISVKISAPTLASEPQPSATSLMEEEEKVVEPDKRTRKGGSYSVRGSVKQEVNVKEISAPTLAPNPSRRRGRRIVTAAVTSPMEEEKVVEMEKHKGSSYSASGSVKQEVDVKKISAREPRMRRGQRIVTAAETSLMEEEKVVGMEKQAGKDGSYSARASIKHDVDVKDISAPTLAPDHRKKHGRCIVAAAVTSPMEKEKMVEMEKQAAKGGCSPARGSIKKVVDVKKISVPTLAPGRRTKRGRQVVTTAATSPMEEKVVEMEKQAGNGISYFVRSLNKHDVDVKEISAPTLAPEPQKRRGRRIVTVTVTSPVEEEKLVEMEKQAGKGGSYSARGSIKQDDDVKEISALTLAPELRMRRGRRIVTAAVTSIEEKVVETEREAGKGGYFSARGSIEQGVDVKEILAPTLAPDHRTKRGRRTVSTAVTSLFEEKVVETEKHAGKGGSFSVRGSIKQDVDENHQKGPVQRKRGIVSTGASRNNKALERVASEGDTTSAEVLVGVLKEKDEERGVVHENAEGPTKNVGRGRSHVNSSADPPTISAKGAPLETVAEKRKKRRAVKALPMPKEDDEAPEMIEGLVKDGRKGPVRTKRRGESAQISLKDDVLGPVAPLRRGKVTRASTMIKEDEKETKEEKVQKTIKNRVKQLEISKKGSRSTRISGKDEMSESVEIEEKIVGSLSSHLEVTEAIQMEDVIVERGKNKKKSKVKDNPIGDGEMLAVRRDVSFMVEETDNHKDAIMSEESNRSSDLDFPNKKELVYSWSSFSAIRGIPNTTSKYREDRMINCHATPFEARVEKALNKGISESSSSVDIEA